MRDENVIEFRGDHIHIIARGNNTTAKSLQLFQRIVAMCEQHDCYNVLGEAETQEDLSTMDGFRHIDIFQKAGITWKHRIAWVAENSEKFEQLEFVETVLRNRALVNGGLFRTVAEARVWLLNDAPADADASKTTEP